MAKNKRTEEEIETMKTRIKTRMIDMEKEGYTIPNIANNMNLCVMYSVLLGDTKNSYIKDQLIGSSFYRPALNAREWLDGTRNNLMTDATEIMCDADTDEIGEDDDLNIYDDIDVDDDDPWIGLDDENW